MTSKTPEPGGVYRWYAVPPRNSSTLLDPFGEKLLHVAMPCTNAEGVVRVMTSSALHKPWTQDWIPAEATLMIPADRGVDVPPGSPRVILRDLPEKLDLSKREHRVLFDRTLSDVNNPTPAQGMPYSAELAAAAAPST